MESNNEVPVPQAVQDVIQATVDRAIATLLESGILKHKKRDGKKRHSRSRSRSRSRGRKDKGKSKKRSSSSSSSSSDSDGDPKCKRKGKKHSRSRSRGKGKRRHSKSRSHSRRHSRSRSRSKSHNHGPGKKGWHHHHDSDSLLPLYHHYFNCPYVWGQGDEPGRSRHEGERRGKRHGHKNHWMKFYGPKDDKKDEANASSKESDLSKEFENLDVEDKEKSHD